MNKSLAFLFLLCTSRAKATLQKLVAMLLLGMSAVNMPVQGKVNSEKVTSNLHNRVKLTRAVTAGTLNLYLAPELPSRVEREHWPIVFITRTNANGEEVQEMRNLSFPEQFSIDIAAGKNAVSVAGEDGLWTVDANNGQISGIELNTPSLHYLQMSNNELRTGGISGSFALPTNLPKLEKLDVSYNKLLKLKLTNGAASLKHVIAVGNGLVNEDYSMLGKIVQLNLQGNRLVNIKVPPVFNNCGEIFDVSSLRNKDFKPTYDDDLKNGNEVHVPSELYACVDGELNLSVNRLKISTLPPAPRGLKVGVLEKENAHDAEGNYKRPKYNVAAQQRYEFDKTEYRLNENIDLSREMSALDQNGTARRTEIFWYKEIEPSTDKYVKIDPNSGDYEIDAMGVTRFKRGFGRDMKIFAELINSAFENPFRDPKDPTAETLPAGLSSFEKANAGTDNTNGYTFTTKQPSGVNYPLQLAAEKDSVGMIAYKGNQFYLKSQIEDALDGDRDCGIYRSNVITLKGNYWYGFVDNDWSKAENWTMRYVPLTTQAEYDALGGDKSEADVEFAISNINQYGSDAIRDLYTDKDRVVHRYINKKNYTPKSLVVQAGHQLKIVSAAYGASGFTGENNPEMLRVKAGGVNKANGTLLVASKTPVKATVELFAQSSEQGSGLQQANWQYFGAPVTGDYNKKSNVFGSSLVRKYNRELSVANSDEKWEALSDDDLIEPGKGYEVATPTPSRYEFKGSLVYKNTTVNGKDAFEFTLGGAPVGNNYNDINILANPFTAAMKIDKIQKKNSPNNIVATYYLFNTGSRQNWLAQNGANVTGSAAGQYTDAIPANLVGHLPGMPTEIPSLSSFAVQAKGAASLYYLYDDLMKVETANKARRMDVAPRVASITVDVASENSMDRLWLVEHEEATDNFDDGLDGEKMLTAGAAQLYVEGAQNLQVSTTNHLTRANLSFIPADKAERYELKFHLDGFNASDEFVLLDKRTGAETKINDGDKYSFIADRNDKRQRFAILRKGASLNDAAQAGFTVLADATRNIEVLNETTESGEVIIVDAAGKSLARFTLAAGARKNVQVSVPGVYVVKAENTQSRFSQSVLVP